MVCPIPAARQSGSGPGQVPTGARRPPLAARRTLVGAMTTHNFTTTEPTTTSALAPMGATGSPRTYDVRTHGCQMNVHDSERLAGLLETAGYVDLASLPAGERPE